MITTFRVVLSIVTHVYELSRVVSSDSVVLLGIASSDWLIPLIHSIFGSSLGVKKGTAQRWPFRPERPEARPSPPGFWPGPTRPIFESVGPGPMPSEIPGRAWEIPGPPEARPVGPILARYNSKPAPPLMVGCHRH